MKYLLTSILILTSFLITSDPRERLMDLKKMDRDGNRAISFKEYSIPGVVVLSHHQKVVSMGKYTLTWNGKDHYGRSLSSGIYLYEFRAGDKFHQTKKMTFLK